MKNKNYKPKDIVFIVIALIVFLRICFRHFFRSEPKDETESKKQPAQLETITEASEEPTEQEEATESSEEMPTLENDDSDMDSITIIETTDNHDEYIDWSQTISEEEFNALPDTQKYIDPKIGMADSWEPGKTPTKEAALDIIYGSATDKFDRLGVFAAIPAVYKEPSPTKDGGFMAYVSNDAGSTILTAHVSPDMVVETALYGSIYNKGYIGTIYNTRPGNALITEEQVMAVEKELINQHNKDCYEIYSFDNDVAVLMDKNGNSYTLNLQTHDFLSPTEGKTVQEAEDNKVHTNMYFNNAHFAVTDAEAEPYLKNGMKFSEIPYLGATAVINMIAMEKNYSSCKIIKSIMSEERGEECYVVMFDDLYYYLIVEDTQYNEAYAIEDTDGRIAAGYPDFE